MMEYLLTFLPKRIMNFIQASHLLDVLASYVLAPQRVMLCGMARDCHGTESPNQDNNKVQKS